MTCMSERSEQTGLGTRPLATAPPRWRPEPNRTLTQARDHQTSTTRHAGLEA